MYFASTTVTGAFIGTTVLMGMLIVFGVLAIIYFALVVMGKLMGGVTKKSAKAFEVTAPFDGTVDYLVAGSRNVAANDVVLVMSAPSGKNEVLAPSAGALKISVVKGASVKKGDTLFTIG